MNDRRSKAHRLLNPKPEGILAALLKMADAAIKPRGRGSRGRILKGPRRLTGEDIDLLQRAVARARKQAQKEARLEGYARQKVARAQRRARGQARQAVKRAARAARELKAL